MMIETRRLIIREWKESDADYLYEYAKDPDIGNAAGWVPHKSVEDSRIIIKDVLSDLYCFAIVLKKENHIIGSIDLMTEKTSNYDDMPKNEAEIGYWMAKPYWGMGYMQEALLAILEYAFNKLNKEKIWCGYFDGNIKSKNLSEKIGFKYHHTNKDILWKITNEIKTEHIGLLTKEDFIKNVFEK